MNKSNYYFLKTLFLAACLAALFVVLSGRDQFKAIASEDYYDLAVAEINISPTSPAVNQDCQIQVKVKNNGTKNLYTAQGLNSYQYNFASFLKSDSSYPSPTLSDVIAPGEYFYYIFIGKFTQVGQVTLSFTIDLANELTEKDEDNNNKEKGISVINAGDFDIAVSAIELSDVNLIVNSSINITVVIKNNGEVSLTSSSGLIDNDISATFSGFMVSNKDHDNYPTLILPLGPGGEFKYYYTGFFNKLGEHSLSFRVDKNNYLAESDEGNNATTTMVNVYLTESDRDNFNILSQDLVYISSSSVMVSWQTDNLTTGKVSFKEYIYQSLENQVGSINQAEKHQAVLENLEANTNYYYKITGIKNTVTKDTSYYNFMTPVSDNLSIIVSPSLVVNNISKSAVLSWSTNLLSAGQVYYKKTASTTYSSSGLDEMKVDHKINLENLTGGRYDYFFISTSTPGTVYKSGLSQFEIIGTISQTPNADNNETGSEDKISQPGGNNQALKISNNNLYKSLKGKIILKVEASGEAYYINPNSEEMYYLGRPDDAFGVMREQGIGITDENLKKIPVATSNLTGQDSDGDGLPDMFEEAVGTDKNKVDSDGDGHNDKSELESGYNPNGLGKLAIDNNFSANQIGKIFLQVEKNGEAWYINPSEAKRYFLGRPADAFAVMRNLGLGISNDNFNLL